MKSTTLTTFLLALPAITYAAPAQTGGCNKSLPKDIHADNSFDQTLSDSKSGVATRKYRIHIPQGYDNKKAVPLILSFHGRTQTGAYQEKLARFANNGFEGIAVYPEGVPFKKDGSVQQWQGDPDSHSINDITFTLELLAHLSSQYCIDTSRIYASGKSNGGAFTGLLACDPVASTRIAAFAAVSPAVYLDNSTSQLPACTPGRTGIPFMELHGQQDKTAAYAGGLNTRSNGYTTDVVKYVNGWAERDGFKVDAKTTSTLCGKGKKEVTKFVWGDERVVHYRYKNVGHDWMSATENLDTAGLGGDARTCKEAEASRVVLEWFGRWKV